MNEPILPRAGSIAWDITEQSDGEQPEDLAHDLSDGEQPHEGSATRAEAPTMPPSVAALHGKRWGAPTSDGPTRARSLLVRIEKRHRGDEKPVETPWPSMNKALGGGLWPGVWFVVGSTGVGKSQWCMDVALSAATEGSPVLYVALELDELGLFARGVELLYGRTASTKNTSPRDWPRWSDLYTGRTADVAADVLDALEALPFYPTFAPPHGWNHKALVPEVRALCDLHPGHTPVVVIDFLQLVTGDERERREKIGAAAYAARACARDLGCVVLCMSSMPRDGYGVARVLPDAEGAARKGLDEKGRPDLGELIGLGKESGDVEFSADGVIVMCPEPERGEQGWRDLHFALAKVRAGRPSWVRLQFNGTRFKDPDAAKYAQPEQSDDVEGDDVGGYNV